MSENMRFETAEQRIARLETQVALWQAEDARCEERERLLRARFDTLQEARSQIGERAVAAEQRIGHLATLLATTQELHTAQQPADVLTVIKEVVANLIGCEEMGIFLRRPDGSLALLDGIGPDPAARAADRRSALDHALRCAEPCVGADGVAAAIPLRIDGRAIGVIALFTLLPQKPSLDAGDLELFELLATHGAMALHHAELRAGA